ncbi:hypothetical protein V7S43_012851 [Phytophthora oleae]|uniref:RxLR effector protein n=1 Tax=Phytophthora oleae TaxID=2107226 RepID=A0ABD3FAK1_9STRA
MAPKPIMHLLLLLVIALAASSKSFAHAEATTIATSTTKEQLALNVQLLRNLKGSTKETDDEDSYDEDEERIFGLDKLKSLLQRKPDAAVTLGKNSGLGKALAGNTNPAYVRANSQVRSYFSANPTMTRGLELYQIDYMIAIVSLFVSIGALGVLIAMMMQRSN